MSVDPNLPGAHGELTGPDRRPTVWWYAWFRRVHTRLVATEATATAASDAVAAIPTVVLPHITGVDPIRMYGDDQNPVITLEPSFAASLSQQGRPGMDGEDGEDAWPLPGPKGDKGDKGDAGVGGGGSGGGTTIIVQEDHYEESWPIPGVAGPTGATGAAGGALTYVGTATVAGAAATTLTMSALDLDADTSYLVQIVLSNATASFSTISLYYNSDTTATNYDSVVAIFRGATLTGARANTGRFIDLTGNRDAAGFARISKDFPEKVNARFDGRNDITTLMEGHSNTHMWRTAATNVTGITLSSSVASALAIGSFMRVWKLDI